jgi:hypothetical protein
MISFSTDDNTSNYFYIHQRLDKIKEFSNLGTIETRKGEFKRNTIKVDYGWIREINIDLHTQNNKNYIRLRFHPGDTKGQGWYIFSKNKEIIWPENILENELNVTPYIKMSHFNHGIGWIELTLEESKKTHNFETFKKICGRKTKDKWNVLKAQLNELLSNKWEEKSNWQNNFELTNRTYVDISFGYKVNILIPYDKAQSLDDKSEGIPKIATEIKNIVVEFKKIFE